MHTFETAALPFDGASLALSVISQQEMNSVAEALSLHGIH